MAEMSMVERVARALARHDNPKHENWWPSYDTRARAAIEAMKDPTIEMMKQARAHHEGEHYLPHSLFNSMIDAALNGKEG